MDDVARGAKTAGQVKHRRVGLLIHGGAVGLLITVFLVRLATSDAIGADIGLGLIGLPTLLLGLPWTVHYLADPYAYDGWPDAARYVLTLGPAVVNLALHAAATWLRSRSR
jgi:hypothetical protein